MRLWYSNPKYYYLGGGRIKHDRDKFDWFDDHHGGVYLGHANEDQRGLTTGYHVYKEANYQKNPGMFTPTWQPAFKERYILADSVKTLEEAKEIIERHFVWKQLI